MDVTLETPQIAAFRIGGTLIARLYPAHYPVPSPDGAVVTLSLYEWDGRLPETRWHYPRADGSCVTCAEYHGWLMDAAIEAGWQCPALEAAVAERLAAGREDTP